MDFEILKKLREVTGAGVMEVKKILEEVGDDYDKAHAKLMEKASAKAAKKADRTAGDGLIFSYVHGTGKIGSLVHVACETDFVAKTDAFKDFCKDLSMQVCVEDLENVEELLSSDHIKQSDKTVSQVVEELTAKLGEKIEIIKFVKYTVK